MPYRTMLISSAFILSVLSAQAIAKEGKFEERTCYAIATHIIQHADGVMSASYDAVGMTPSTENSPLRTMSSRCLGSFTEINGDHNENGSCEFVNASGDKVFLVYARKGDPAKTEGTWHFVHGTGKFSHVSGEGGWIPTDNFPPTEPNMMTSCNREWGTYKF
jgi:hypothetical protein